MSQAEVRGLDDFVALVQMSGTAHFAAQRGRKVRDQRNEEA
jgi:hypothetical protein